MKQPWIYTKSVDLFFILMPSFFVWLITWSAVHFFDVSNLEVSPIVWLFLIVGIDVSHVYSTLYRTYFDKEAFQRHRKLYVWTPIVCLFLGYGLVLWSMTFFWTVMAYLAIFHFIRQQYGFMRIYTRKEVSSNAKAFSGLTIYSVSVIPVLMWHVGPPKMFHWFVEGDLWLWPQPTLYIILHLLFWLVLGVYCILELSTFLLARELNIPKNLLLFSTALAWYFGIVVNNGDLIFSALNIVSHGIPYMALIWIYGKKKNQDPDSSAILAPKFTMASYFGVTSFLGLLFLFAFSEEFLWDNLIWHDHPEFFGYFLDVNTNTMAYIFTPMLSLPQLTHYVLDGFIWKIKHDKHEWRKVVLT